MKKEITLAQGNGGAENAQLISDLFYKQFKNETLQKSEDAAIIEDGKLAFTTDSFTVSPLFFGGGDIGKLSICGTCNDLAMMGAKPKYLTCSFIIEEGFSYRDLQKIVKSMQKELQINEALIVSGDTKVVPKGSVDGLFINTTGIGVVQKKGLSSHNLKEGMSILLSRDIGSHGAAIFSAREGIDLESSLESDCASLYPVVKSLIDAKIGLIALRDATRGGVAAVLNEWASSSTVCIEIEEESIPVSDRVRGICELLGFDALSLANEGTFVLATSKEDEKKTLEILKSYNQNAKIIGSVSNHTPKRVILNSSWGTKRFLDLPTGELLPRIC